MEPVSGLASCPVFRPTAEEWNDNPLSYIARVVRPQAEVQAGIAKIIPPAGWSPGFAIDKDRLKFRTTSQPVCQLQTRETSAPVNQWWEDYQRFLRSIGSRHKKNPTYLSQEIDLYRLYRLVSRKGGYQVVTEDKGWKEIGSSLELNDKSGNIAYTLRQLYQKLLLPYEDHLRSRVEAVSKGLESGPTYASSARDSSPDDPDAIDDAEAAEILEAMLGLAPMALAAEPAKKKRRPAPQETQQTTRAADQRHAMVCERCSGGHYEEKIVLCDRCDKGWHIFCLSPPLDSVPEAQWVCPACLASEDDGCGDQFGEEYTLPEFEQAASAFESQVFGGDASSLTPEQRIAQFWHLLGLGTPENEALQAMYSELDCSKVGSGFPTDQHPWNLTNIPSAGLMNSRDANLLQWLENAVSGASSTRLHIGMLFASLCWHISDNQWYSMTYNHWGAAKTWYAIPSYAAGLFEMVLKKALPSDIAHRFDVLFDPPLMMDPAVLQSKGVPVYGVVQEPGEYIVTFPNAYNCQVDLGLNCSESINFAPADWLRFGSMNVSRYRHYHRAPVVAYERLLVNTAKAGSSGLHPRVATWVNREMHRVYAEELTLRTKLWSEGLVHSRSLTATHNAPTKHSDKKEGECLVCHSKLYLSFVECDCSVGNRSCLQHALNLCSCQMQKKRLVYRHSLDELINLRANLLPNSENSALSIQEVDKELSDFHHKQAEAIAALQLAPDVLDDADDAIDQEQAVDMDATDSKPGQMENRKRKREETSDGERAIVMVSGDGFVQGPVKPFKTLDIYPEDQNEAEKRLQERETKFELWRSETLDALTGSPDRPNLAENLDRLLEESEQYTWGHWSKPEYSASVADVVPRLRAACDYLKAITSALRSKPTLEALESLLAQHPEPIPNAPGLDKLQETALAGKHFQVRAQELLSDKGVVDYRVLEQLVSESSRLPVSVTESRALRERLSTARKIADTIRSALPTAREAGRRKKDDAQISIEEFRQLRAQAMAVRVDMSEYSNLAQALERLEVWQSRVKALTDMRAPLSELKELVEESEGLPANVPEVESVRALISKGESWLRSAHSLLKNKATLKKLRDLLHSGLRLPVEMPEVEELRQEIRRREWEDTARKAIHSKNTLTALLEALATANDMGASGSALAENLRSKVEAAEAWDYKAVEFINKVEEARQGSIDDQKQRPRLEELHMIVVEGQATGVKIERLTQLTNALAAARKWLNKSQECLASTTEEQQGDAVHEGADAAGDDTATAGTNQQQQANKGKRARPGRPSLKLPHLVTVEGLLNEFTNTLMIYSEEAEGLRELRKRAEAWLLEAKPVLEQSFVTDEQLPLLTELIAAGKPVGLSMEQLDILEANVEALLWGRKARKVLVQLPYIPGLVPILDAETYVPPAALEDTVVAQHDEDMDVDAVKGEDGVVFSGAGVYSEETKDKFPVRPVLPFAERPPLVELVALLEEGGILPCEENTYLTLQRHVEAGKAFDEQASAILSTTKDGVPARQTHLEELRDLIEYGESLGQQIPSIINLSLLLDDQDAWENKMKDIMDQSGPRPPYEALVSFQHSTQGTPVTSELRQHVAATIAKVEDWQDRCRRAIAKRNTNMQLERCLDIIAYSVDCAVDQFERCLEAEKRMVSSSSSNRLPPPRPDAAVEDEDERELYCLCQQHYNVDSAMISCDSCGEWYHLRCVGMSQAQVRGLRRYACPICLAVKGNSEQMDLALAKLKRTKRPFRKELDDLLKELKTLPVSVDIEPQLERILTRFDRWTTATYRAIEVHEASRLVASNGQVLPLSDHMLQQLTKSALAMEIHANQHAERLITVLRCNSWRNKAEDMLEATGQAKSTVDVYTSLLEEAGKYGVAAADDVVGVAVKTAIREANEWMIAAQECIIQLKAMGGDMKAFIVASEMAQGIIKQGEELPVKFGTEMAELKELSTLFCLCKKPYDAQTPMVSCVHCNKRYHHECVGLKPPGTASKDEELGNCPVCCIKYGAVFKHEDTLPKASKEALKDIYIEMNEEQKRAAAEAASTPIANQAATTPMSTLPAPKSMARPAGGSGGGVSQPSHAQAQAAANAAAAAAHAAAMQAMMASQGFPMLQPMMTPEMMSMMQMGAMQFMPGMPMNMMHFQMMQNAAAMQQQQGRTTTTPVLQPATDDQPDKAVKESKGKKK